MISRSIASVGRVKRNFAFLPMNSVCRFNDEELQLQSMVRNFCKKNIDPIAA